MAYLKSGLCVEGFMIKIHKIGHSWQLLDAQISKDQPTNWEWICKVFDETVPSLCPCSLPHPPTC